MRNNNLLNKLAQIRDDLFLWFAFLYTQPDTVTPQNLAQNLDVVEQTTSDADLEFLFGNTVDFSCHPDIYLDVDLDLSDLGDCLDTDLIIDALADCDILD